MAAVPSSTFSTSVPSDEIAKLRVPPHSIEAEQSVLGGLLLDNSAWDRAADLLVDTDFYRHEHQLIYTAIRQLVNASKPADVITVFEQLQMQGKAADVGGLAYLNALAQSMPSAANIRRYAEIVRERAVLRKLVTASDEIATSAFNTQGLSVDAILDQAGAKLSAVLENGGERDDDERTLRLRRRRHRAGRLASAGQWGSWRSAKGERWAEWRSAVYAEEPHPDQAGSVERRVAGRVRVIPSIS